MKKRGNILLFISLCLICSFAIRVYFVNRDVSKPPMKEYKKGEIVTFDEEYSVTKGKLAKDTPFKFWTPRYCPLKISERSTISQREIWRDSIISQTHIMS